MITKDNYGGIELDLSGLYEKKIRVLRKDGSLAHIAKFNCSNEEIVDISLKIHEAIMKGDNKNEETENICRD